MHPQSSPSRETYTRYSDGEDQANSSPTTTEDTKRNQRLLQEVLGETLIRSRENSEHLAVALQVFRQQHSDLAWDENLFVLIVAEVLKHRLGERSAELPGDLFAEVGLAFWSHPESRARIERLWNQLGASS